MTAKSYSKSVLRVAADVVVNSVDRTEYYPRCESIMNSEINATWRDDMVHVPREAVAANVGRMVAEYVAPGERL